MFDREITKAFRLIRMKKRAINRQMEAQFNGECRFIDWLSDEEGCTNWDSLLIVPSERYFDDYPLLEGHCSMLLENNFLKELIIGLDRVRSGDNIDGSNEHTTFAELENFIEDSARIEQKLISTGKY